MEKIYNKKTILGWTLYDWANSVYSLSITSAIFPIYFNSITTTDNSDKVSFFGIEFINTALYSYAISFSFLFVALLNPILSGIADYTGRKKNFMQFFCYLGSISCIGLFFFTSGKVELGIILSVLACIGYAGSIVFYNAYLPEVVPKRLQDQVSARGFSMGYLGSTLLLILNLLMIQFPHLFGISDGNLAARISFVLVGIWWFSFAQITFRTLPKPVRVKKITSDILLVGYKNLIQVFSILKGLPRLKYFLLAFFFYNMSTQTIMYVATLFGTKELEMDDTMLILTIFIIQIVAIGGAYSFSKISSKIGNIKSLMISVLIWICIAISAYFVQTSGQFIVLAFFVGSVMGGVQALSRSTYSKLLPQTENTASFFSFYDFTDKVSLVFGTFLYGFIEVITGTMRNSILFFVSTLSIGLFILYKLLFILKNER